MPWLYWKIMWEYMFPQYLQGSGLKFIERIEYGKNDCMTE